MPAITEAGAKEPAPSGGEGSGPAGLAPLRRASRRAARLWREAGLGCRLVRAAALLVVLLLALMVFRLPWAGDLGIHAATLERLRHDLGHPGDPLVDADVPSPYYSPWMVLLALVGKATGLSTFGVLRVAAAVNLVLLLTGIRRFVRGFSTRPAAVPLAVLGITLLYGWSLFTWSGFPGLTSLALCLAYPSTFAMGAAFHLWALLRDALARDWRLPAHLGLGLLLAVILLSHQFTGVVTVLGLLAIVLGARPWPGRAVWPRLAAGVALAVAVLLVWPYYSFFSLLGAGNLDAVHRSLYVHLVPRFALLLIAVAALAVRWWRDRRDPLVLLFAMGVVIYAAGGITGHYAWGRVLPAVFIAAQVGLAVEVAGGPNRAARRVLAPLTAVGLLVGCWAQIGTLTYVVSSRAIPGPLRHAPREKLWTDYKWITPYVRYGQVIMTHDYAPLRQAPAWGGYTVASGYTDFFLPDAHQRTVDTRRYFAASTSRAERLALLRKYHVTWVIEQRNAPGGLALTDPALRLTAADSENGEVLLRVVDDR